MIFVQSRLSKWRRVLFAPLLRFLQKFNLLTWTFLAFTVGGTAARVLELISGIVIIRSVSPVDYATYGIMVATAPIFSMILLSGILPVLWTHVSRREGAEYVLAARSAAESSLYSQNWWVVCIGTAAVIVLLTRVAEGPIDIALGTLAVLAMSVITAQQAINDASLQLLQKQGIVTIGALGQSLIRLAALPLLSFHNHAVALMLAAAIFAAFLNCVYCRHMLGDSIANPNDSHCPAFASEVSRMRRRSLATDAFQALSGQYYYWLLAFFAGPVALAGFAALTRLSQVLFPLALLFRGYFVPGFAKLESGVSIAKYFLALLGCAALLILPVASIPLLWPAHVLQVLGPNYLELTAPLMVYSAGMLFWITADLADQLLRSRGYFQSPMIGIALDCIALAAPALLASEITVYVAFICFLSLSLMRLARLTALAALSFRPTIKVQGS
ncbi:hypothetical protein [Bradyrhizobium sp. 187]|uniref:hypothetical protein n=1 Tax=Bradyrhizobium sp. 187 TaxID=2782655 RepID=UPI001FFF00C3|nr:hypothetical protein [Bradyrhizobium sp. 187]UPJ74480.1 hypothetical protein IVB19_08080 [Bradyrhizobium sp. 187]